MSADPADHVEVEPSPVPESDSRVRHLHPVEGTETEPVEGEIVAADHDDPATDGEQERGEPPDFQVWLTAVFAPASGLYTERQPAIAETVRRAREGGQLPAAGPLRTLGIGYGYVAAGYKAVSDTTAWVVAHPARLAVLAVLVGLALVFPPTRYVAGYLLTPFVWAQHALL